MESTSEESRDFSSMESLPTEILQKILSYLPVHDRIRVERVCRRWKNVSTERVWRDVQVLSIVFPRPKMIYHRFRDASLVKCGKFITMEDNELYIDADQLEIIASVLSRAGQHVKKLMYLFYSRNNRTTEQILSIIIDHCHNIESIQLDYYEFSAIEVFSKLLEVNKQLHSIEGWFAENIFEILPLRNWKSLRLRGVRLGRSAQRMVALIENSPSLEEFYVDLWELDMLVAIQKCERLRKLSFPNLCDMADNDIDFDWTTDISFLNRLTCLTLDSNQPEGLISDLLRNCINLERLCIHNYSDFVDPLSLNVVQAVLALPKLESLEIDGSIVYNRVLRRLLKFKHLSIVRDIGFFTENELCEMITNSECLEELEIPRNTVTTEFFKRLVRHTRKCRKILKMKIPPKIYKEALKVCEGSSIHVITDIDFVRQ